MKRKIAEGDKNFTYLLEKYPSLTSYVKKIFYLYRAFGKFMLSDYSQTILDYEEANKQIPLDSYAKYNKLLAQGIVQVNKRKYD